MMNRLLLVLVSLLFWNFSLTAQIIKKEPFSIGESLHINSKILNEERVLNVSLPFGYHPDSMKTYPVIYLLDGSKEEDFIHIAGLVQFGTFSWIQMVPESIVVGIANIDRKKDFTFPSTDPRDIKEFPTTGGSEAFINFIEKELQPLIAKQYKTTETKIIIGQSLGGLLATEILYKKPDLFTHYMIISPSLWWDNLSMMDKEPSILNEGYTTEKSIFIGWGKEGKQMEGLAMGLASKLMRENRENIKISYAHFPEQDHGDVLHRAIYKGFEALFPRKE